MTVEDAAANANSTHAISRELKAILTSSTGEVSNAGTTISHVAGVAIRPVGTHAQATLAGAACSIIVAASAVGDGASFDTGSSVKNKAARAQGTCTCGISLTAYAVLNATVVNKSSAVVSGVAFTSTIDSLVGISKQNVVAATLTSVGC